MAVGAVGGYTATAIVLQAKTVYIGHAAFAAPVGFLFGWGSPFCWSAYSPLIKIGIIEPLLVWFVCRVGMVKVLGNVAMENRAGFTTFEVNSGAFGGFLVMGFLESPRKPHKT